MKKKLSIWFVLARFIIWAVETITFNKVRGKRTYVKQSLMWWWTPWTSRFKHGGWICLNIRWLWAFK